MNWTTISLTIALASSALALPARAQADACPAPGDTAAAPARSPDVVIAASVTADEVTFRSRPAARVQVSGCAAPDSVRVTERRNLPSPVQPGVTYRDVRVAIEIHAWIDPECLLAGLDLTGQPTATPAQPTASDPATCLRVGAAPPRPGTP